MMRNHARNDRRGRTAARRGFTLVEMLVVVMILGLLSGMVLLALAGAGETAREARTRGQIQKLNEFIMTRYESYRTRRTPRGTSSNPIAQARQRVDQIRALMVQEMPDRKTDLQTVYTPGGSFSTIYARHQRAIMAFTGNSTWGPAYAAWTPDNQHSECLYLILASITDGETNALDFLHDSEVGDTDDDGVPEVLDGWGNPIAFLRWPQGHIGIETSLQDIRVFDSLDPLRVRGDLVTNTPLPAVPPGDNKTDVHPLGTGFAHFNLMPLVVSAGKDGIFDIGGDESAATNGDAERGIHLVDAASTGPLDFVTAQINPYFHAPLSINLIDPDNTSIYGVGVMMDVNGDGYDNSVDNISNHYLIVGGNAP
ncbi:type II secretion system GspH family protein [Blastopirellula sp. J2-11]|uniref:type II secretion system protein n=1 Tax=Blastopirellula sp. J2-11 TaxID=2943192 RepID=UPI0021C88F7E|nr:type II secretion system protein [Blastopirellula sp. J2-11]UUO05259.1 type II secretion system GspH family protein [Blastopirellula sp. J2-11]